MLGTYGNDHYTIATLCDGIRDITDEVLFGSYEDPHYEQDVLDFFANYPWKDNNHDDHHGGGTVNPYPYMNSEFVQNHPELWKYFDWDKVLKCIELLRDFNICKMDYFNRKWW